MDNEVKVIGNTLKGSKINDQNAAINFYAILKVAYLRCLVTLQVRNFEIRCKFDNSISSTFQ